MIASMASSALTKLPVIKLPKIRSSLPNKQLPPQQNRINSKSRNVVNSLKDYLSSYGPLKLLSSGSIPLTAFTLPFFLDPQDAQAIDGQFGILESKSFALIHPIVMSGLFVLTLYTGSLGLQVRKLRTIQEEIEELKKQVKPVAVAAGGRSSDGSRGAPSQVEARIQRLTEERKELMQGSYKDRHFTAGSVLLGFGVFEAVFGALDTYIRKGQLLIGPHLFAGTAITVLWAAAASLVPAMQKGNKDARNLHVILNGLNVILFLVQVLSGIEMLFKVL